MARKNIKCAMHPARAVTLAMLLLDREMSKPGIKAHPEFFNEFKEARAELQRIKATLPAPPPAGRAA